METKRLQELLADPARISILSTADDTGTPNSAIFGSAGLKDGQILIGCGDTRSLTNLRQNRKAGLMVTIPGANVLSFKGVRLQLECVAIEDSGADLEQMREEVRATAGRSAARMIGYLIRFDIVAERDLVDMSALFTPK